MYNNNIKIIFLWFTEVSDCLGFSILFLIFVMVISLVDSGFFFCLGSGGGPPNDRSGDFIVQEDTIFVSGMSTNTSEGDIEQHFGSIGIIKVIYLTYHVLIT